MAATPHAIWMMALPLLTACICWQSCRRPPMFKRTLLAIFLALPVFFFPDHLCDAGRAFFQRFIAGLCLAAVLTFSTSRWAATALGLVFALVSVALISHYDSLVHGETYTGRRGDRLGPRSRKHWALEEARKALDTLEAVRLPAGWISDIPSVTTAMAHSPKQQREVGESLWHSGFTNLFRKMTIPVELWSPGGMPGEVAALLEWRDR